MGQPRAQGLAFTQVTGTCLYQAGTTQTLVFLRWNTTSPPASLTLEEVWAASGPPGTPGYLVFLNSWSVSSASTLETTLRAVLTSPVGTGFVWASVAAAGTPPVVTVQTCLATKLNGDNLPCVDGNTPLAGLPGGPKVGFSDRSPVTASEEDGCITGFVITNPPMGTTPPPSGRGVSLPMAGTGIGCVQFSGLVDAPGRAQAGVTQACKAAVSVSIDPLHPIDSKRNYMIYTGSEYVLAFDGSTYHLWPAS